MEGFVLMLIQPKNRRPSAEEAPVVQGPNRMISAGVLGVVLVVGVILAYSMTRPEPPPVVEEAVAKPVPVVTVPVVAVAAKEPVATVESTEPVAKTNVIYGGESLQKNLDAYRAKQADDLRKQLDDGLANGKVDSLTLSEDRIRKLEQSGNAVW